jgi:type IV fimbrial biogenesis protein FimT
MVELMVTVGLLVVLMSVAVPSFQATIQGNRITTSANDVVAALQFARSEAVRRGVNVTLCSSSDQSTCSGAWTDGWVVLAAGLADPIRVWPALRPGMTLAAGGNAEFNPLGGVTAPRCYQLDLGTFRRSVTVGPGGRVITTTDAC